MLLFTPSLNMLCGAIIKHFYIQSSLVQIQNKLLLMRIYRFLCSYNSSVANVPILQDRFINYFNKNTNYSFYTIPDITDSASTMIQFPKPMDPIHFHASLMQKMKHITVAEVPLFLYNLHMYKHVIPSQDFHRILLASDDIYSEKLFHMDRESILKCVGLWFNLCQGKTANSKIYETFMQTASCWLIESNYQLEHLVYIMFFIGLSKKNKEAQHLIKSCLRKLDKFANSLTLDELCIMGSSSYKCSVRIDSAHLLHCICNAMKINFELLISDAAYLVTFMKVLRFAKHYDFKMLDRLANKKHTNEILKMNLTAKVHILAMYADALYDKNGFIHLLIQSCIEDTRLGTNENNLAVLRLKDISRLLWATSYLGYSLLHEEVKNITCELQRSINEKNHLKNPEHIVGSLLSLWMMGLKEHVLFKAGVTEDFMVTLKEMQLFRAQARLSLLFTCIQIEMPEILEAQRFAWNAKNTIPPEALKLHLHKRSILKQLFTVVTNLAHHKKLNCVCECHIPNLNILGITVTFPSGKILHIEVLDKTVCLYGTYVPHGLMKLKLRLLKSMGHQVIVVCDNQFYFESDTSKIYMFVEEELSKLQNRYGA